MNVILTYIQLLLYKDILEPVRWPIWGAALYTGAAYTPIFKTLSLIFKRCGLYTGAAYTPEITVDAFRWSQMMAIFITLFTHGLESFNFMCALIFDQKNILIIFWIQLK